MAGGGVILAAAGPSPLWYLSRGTGAVTLVALSASVILGITGTLRWRLGARTPRFVVDGLHRNVSLLVVVLLAAHVVTSLLDPFAHFGSSTRSSPSRRAIARCGSASARSPSTCSSR